ncbi:MAG: response regulator [Candidatus Pacebacteria bacterium]|nr:response regulator [Candidatus Paceibacterota bacterium]
MSQGNTTASDLSPESEKTMDKVITVFLLDDDDFLLDMYSVKFKSSGFSVESSKSTDDALNKLKGGFRPDIMLLDVVMPKMTGLEFLEALKTEGIIGKFPIIILSNLGQKDDIDKGIKLGASDYIVKANFTPTEVVEKIKSVLERKRA